jgi:predicted nucleic-acid-binding protein
VLTAGTDVVVRLLTNDDAAQARRVAALFAKNEIFLPKSVILETEWVLRFSYELDRAAILRGLRGILGVPSVSAENPSEVAAALEWYAGGLDFADALHLAAAMGTEGFASFDRKLASRAKGVATVPIVAP